jgi:hypothetical protein
MAAATGDTDMKSVSQDTLQDTRKSVKRSAEVAALDIAKEEPASQDSKDGSTTVIAPLPLKRVVCKNAKLLGVDEEDYQAYLTMPVCTILH